MLTGIVEEARVLSERSLHDIFERFSFPLAAFDEVVSGIDVSEVVLVMMIFQRFT